MLIVILIDVQYSQKAAFSFENGSNSQIHSSSGSLHPVKKFPLVKFPSPVGAGSDFPTHHLKLFGKPWTNAYVVLWWISNPEVLFSYAVSEYIFSK